MINLRFNNFLKSDEDSSPLLNSGRSSGNVAFLLVINVMIMVMFGLAMLYSTSSGAFGAKMFTKQLVWALAGVFFATCIYIVGYRKMLEYSVYLLLISCFLLIIARMNRAINGSHRWIRIGSLSVQPSEFAKLAIIMFLANYCGINQKWLNKFKEGLLPVGAAIGITAGLVFLGKDLGTTALLSATCFFMLFVAGIRLRYLFLVLITVVPTIFAYLKYHDPERWSRLTSFLDPESCAMTDGYQLWMSLLALGSGFWTGLGFTQSRMKGMYLPEAHTDFILSIVGEELGYVAICAVILAYIAFFLLSLSIAIRARDRQGMLLAFGIAIMVALQSAINIGVISGALPTKGIPAPFISYGGTNLLVSLCACGLLLSVAKPLSPIKDEIENMSSIKPFSLQNSELETNV